MIEREATGVQGLAGKRDGPQRVGPERVALLADERVPAQPRLNPDLVAPPGAKAHLDERRVAVGLEHAIVADRLAGPRVLRMRFFLDQRLRIPHEVIAPRPLGRVGPSVYHGPVDSLGLAPLELFLQRRLRPRILGEEDEP